MTSFDTFELDSPLPQALDAEKAVLGAILLNGAKVMARVQPILRPEMFQSDSNRQVWGALKAIIAEGGVPDLTLVRRRLADGGERGKAAYVSSLIDSIPDSANIERYATIVREKAEARAVISACSAASRAIMDGDSAANVASSLQFAMSSLGAGEERRSRGIGDVALKVRLEADELAKAGRSRNVRTGFPKIDKMTGGFPRKNLTLIAARSSHGKTALAMNTLVGAVGADASLRAGAYSLEMADDAIVNVLRAMGTKIPVPRLQDWAELPEYDRDMVLAYDAWLMKYNERFFLNDRLSDIDEICADARMLKAESGLDLVFVDYLQLVDGFRSERVRERVVNQIGKQLFMLAKQIDVAVVAPVQVTKSGWDRLSIDDVRESKALTHDARLVLMLNRPWQAHKDHSMNSECDATLQVEKNRGGRTGDLKLHFAGATQLFSEEPCPANCRYRG